MKKTRNITYTALFAAIISILSVISVPVGTIPISLGLFGVLISALCLSLTQSILSVAVYLLLGIIGLPVFSGFRSGISMLAGPTGGYLLSYIAVSAVTGKIARFAKGKSRSVAVAITLSACCIGVTASYIIGTAFYSITTGTTFVAALSLCVFPFIPFDIIKAVTATLVSIRLKALLR